MINHVYLQVTLPALSLGSVFSDAQIAAMPADTCVAWTNSVGHALIREVSIEIGGQKIDKHYGTWLEIWDELTQVAEKQNGYNHMIGKYESDFAMRLNAENSRIYYVPLMFWFCRNPGLSLPLIALQYHEVKLLVEFRDASELIVALKDNGERYTAVNVTSVRDSSGVTISSAAFWVDYVYLDTKSLVRKVLCREYVGTIHEKTVSLQQFNTIMC